MNFSSALTRVGSAGALVAVIAAPCCFPLFAALGTTIGLGALAPYEGVILTVFQGFALLTLIGLALSFSLHHNSGPVVLGTLTCGILAYHFYWKFSLAALYSGLLGLVAATLWNYFATRNWRRPILQSTITCPQCGHRKEETMPISACLFSSIALHARCGSNPVLEIAVFFAAMAPFPARRFRQGRPAALETDAGNPDKVIVIADASSSFP